jgi:sec-independent protein translocase protein TatB
MHFADSIVIFLLALVLFGPKRLPEIGRQIGKLLAEFRRASNDFKMQIDDELRAMEQQERQKKLEAAAADQVPALSAPEPVTEPTILPPSSSPLSISPPSTGEVVSTDSPYAPVTPPELPESAHATVEASSLDVASLDIGSNGYAGVPDAATLNGTEPEKEHATLRHG